MVGAFMFGKIWYLYRECLEWMERNGLNARFGIEIELVISDMITM